MDDLTYLSALALAAAIRERRVSSAEAVDAYLARIERYNPALNAIVTLDAEGARCQAAAADAAVARGEGRGPLHGVPITLKDSHATAGMRTTAGYAPLAAYLPPDDGTVAARMKAAGAVLLGKTNVPTLLMDIQTDNPIFGRTNNPWDLARTPGGSSGGAAAALAARLSALDVGSDFAGSIRIPAAFCGLFGLKPTEGCVPMTGHIPDLPGGPRAHRVMWSIGPLARSLDDLELAYSRLVGPDGRDAGVPPVTRGLRTNLRLRDLRLAWAPTFPGLPVAASIRGALAALAAELDRQGARVEERLPEVNIEDQVRLRGRLSKAIQDAYEPAGAGSSPPSLADYFTYLQARDAAIAVWEAFFGAWDALLCPVAMTNAFPHTPTDTPLPVDGAPHKYWRVIGHCGVFSLTGHPVVVIPLGRDADGMPIGIQIVGRRWEDTRLLGVARAITEVSGPFVAPPGYA
jgi:amidase